MSDHIHITHFKNPIGANLCYSNSVATCLANMTILQTEIKEFQTTSPVKKLIEILLALKSALDTADLRDQLSQLICPDGSSTQYSGQQEDAAEFFEQILCQLISNHPTLKNRQFILSINSSKC
jgi:hypothetical protein